MAFSAAATHEAGPDRAMNASEKLFQEYALSQSLHPSSTGRLPEPLLCFLKDCGVSGALLAAILFLIFGGGLISFSGGPTEAEPRSQRQNSPRCRWS